MNFLLDPNVSYFLLVCGLGLAVFALFSPGTGLLEIGAFFLLLMAGYGVISLPINWWAVVILIAGVFPFLVAVRKSQRNGYLVLSLAALTVGSVFLFRPAEGLIAINPWLALVTTTLMLGFLWVSSHKALQAIRQPPTMDLGRLVGMIGVVHADIQRKGVVYINGEEWTARSSSPIPAGQPVRVIARDGLVLVVEPLPAHEQQRNQ